MSVVVDASFYASQLSSADVASLSHKARESSSQGRFAEALDCCLRIVAHKEQVYGSESLRTADSYCEIGILCTQLGRLDGAEAFLNKALSVRIWQGPELDAAITREHLAQVYEMRGKLREARAIRLVGAPDNMVCSNRQVRCLRYLHFLPLAHTTLNLVLYEGIQITI